MSGKYYSTQFEEAEFLNRLGQDVASGCGFEIVPSIQLRRGRGGDWNPKDLLIRIGRLELSGDPDYLWYIVAHELAHAQAEKRESHSIAFWLRLGKALDHAGKVELLRYGYAYRETAMRVAEEYGLADVPKRRRFKLAVGTTIDDSTGKKWKIYGRFRRAGQPFYRLRTRGWRWTSSESVLLPEDGID